MKGHGFIGYEGEWLSDVTFNRRTFPESILQKLRQIQRNIVQEMHDYVSDLLFQAIHQTEAPCFLIPEIIHFIGQVRKEVLPTYHLSSFEFWLSQKETLSLEEKNVIRGKIVGKYLPKNAYQVFFPEEQEPAKAHFSVAHLSPDVDTTVASWIGFLDAFGAGIGENRNHWVLPGGAPKSVEIEFAFYEIFSPEIFEHLALTSKTYQLTALDLLTQRLHRKNLKDLSYGMHSTRGSEAVIVIDQSGHFISDWKPEDVDMVRTVINRFLATFAEFENTFHREFMKLLSDEKTDRERIQQFLQEKLAWKFSHSRVFGEFTFRQKQDLDLFMKEVLGLSAASHCSIEEFLRINLADTSFDRLLKELQNVTQHSSLFQDGKLVNDRTKIFSTISHIVEMQTKSFQQFRRYLDSLEVAIAIKDKVLNMPSKYVSHLADYEEIKEKLEDSQYITVVYKERGKLYPLGVVHRTQLKDTGLASVSLRDFSNFKETNLPSSCKVISIIDHHKSRFETEVPALIHIEDVQSANVIVAHLLFGLNDQYQKHISTLESLNHQIAEASEVYEYPMNLRIMKRLLTRKEAVLRKNAYFVSFEREFIEYFQILIAILDDTDLLTKVTPKDVHCVKELINRLKSLQVGKEVEVVNFDAIENEPDFAKEAAKILLQTYDLYSLYAKVQKKKEHLLEKLITSATKNESDEDAFFQDTKILGGGYAAVSQFKHFPDNIPLLEKMQSQIHKIWRKRCETLHKNDPEVRLFLFMRSSLPGAQELYEGKNTKVGYKDELWLYIPEHDALAINHLKAFLRAFEMSPKVISQHLEVVISKKISDALKKAIVDTLLHTKDYKEENLEPSIVVIRVAPQSINSRKTDIATCL